MANVSAGPPITMELSDLVLYTIVVAIATGILLPAIGEVGRALQEKAKATVR